MDAQIYNFPTGDKQSTPMRAWIAPVSAGVWFVGVRPHVLDREKVFVHQPYFLVQIYNGVLDDKTIMFVIEVEGVKGLYATLSLLVDAAHTRDQGFTIADYSNGETGLAEEYRLFAD